MITGIIAAVILIAVLPPAINNGEMGVLAVAVIAVIFLLMLGSASRKCDRAYGNFVDYWAYGIEEERRAERENERTRTAYIAERMPTEVKVVPMPVIIKREPETKREIRCRSCGRTLTGNGTLKILWDGRAVREYTCPHCKLTQWRYYY